MIIYPLYLPVSDAAADRRIGPLNVNDYGNYFIGVTFSGGGGDLAGTLTLEGSATPDFARFWTITSSSQAVTASAAKYWNISDVSYPYVRVFWDFTSGTGNIAVDASMRQPIISRGA